MSVEEVPQRIVKSREPLDGDGSALAIVARVKLGLKREGNSKDDIALFEERAKSGDYDHLLATAIAWTDDSE